MIRLVFLFSILFPLVSGNVIELTTNTSRLMRFVVPMYGPEGDSTIKPSVVKIVFDARSSTGIFGCAIYNFRHDAFVGWSNSSTSARTFFCPDKDLVSANSTDYVGNIPWCKGRDQYDLIIDPIFEDIRNRSFSTFFYTAEPASPLQRVSYSVPETGLFVIVIDTLATGVDGLFQLKATVEFQHSYGLLPADQFPFLAFYGTLSVVYLVIGVIWMIASAFFWREILPMQNYVALIIFFLMIETASQFGYYDDYNKQGVPSNFLFIVMIIMYSLRNSLSLAMLLVVSMGYSIVIPSLGSATNRIQLLTYAHFAFSTMYAGSSLVFDQTQSFGHLLLSLPLSLAYSIFMVWILSALRDTMDRLTVRRQTVKFAMYRNLRIVLVGLFVWAVIISIVVTISLYGAKADLLWYANHWQAYWFYRDGWPHILYLIGFICVAWLVRPRPNNSRYGLEQLVNQDENDIEDGTNNLPLQDLTRRHDDEDFVIDEDDEAEERRPVKQVSSPVRPPNNNANSSAPADNLFGHDFEQIERELAKLN